MRAIPEGRLTMHGLILPPAQGLQGLQADAAHGLQGFFAAHGLQGLHAPAAQGLQGLHAAAAHGLQGLHLGAHGLQAPAHGLHGLHDAASISGRASADGLAILSALMTATGETATSPPTTAAYNGLRANPRFCFELT